MCEYRHRIVSLLIVMTVILLGILTAAAGSAGETRCGDRVTVGEKILVEKDEVVKGDVVCVGADVEISGTVKGDVVCICGDMVLKKTAVVEGDIVAVGGKIEKHSEAEVHGESVSIGIQLKIDEGDCDARSSI